MTAAVLSTQAQAVSFELMDGEIEGTFDSNISYGITWAASNPDKDYIGANNGGAGLSQTTDDNHLNYKKGQRVSEVVKGIHDLELTYGDSGVFVRGKYWYDFEQRRDTEFKNISDKGRRSLAQTKGAEFLDYYAWHNYEFLEQPGSVRLGNQVVSWGESTFIQNSINSINPVDVSAFRKPGAEIKEGLMPVPMLYVQQGITDNLSFEAFYQFEWEPTTLDNCGTFFSGPDVAAQGCNDNLTVLAPLTDADVAALNAGIAATAGGLGLTGDYSISGGAEGTIVPRVKNDEPSDSGQWGAALRWYVPELNDTEFGAYFIHYHSRTPVLSGVGASQDVYDIANAIGDPSGRVVIAGNSEYFMEYAEDIRLYGLSFATTLGTTAVSGEVSYRPNSPIGLNTTDVLFSGLASSAYLGGALGNVSLINGSPGETVHGYVRKEVTQAQLTAIHFFDQVMGASRLSLVGEVGANWVGGLDDSSDLRYGRDPVFGTGPLNGFLAPGVSTCDGLATSLSGGQNNYCEDEGFVTDFSWGYRARATWEYNDVFAGINLKPSLAWQHDVDGFSPNTNFLEDRKAVSVALRADYLNTYNASVSFTDFFDGKYNTTQDRDFFAASVGMTF
ncbi:DUF1302 domain-containing protein [Aestuariirhabdus sp. Z084]|uniref:DUF1302 domain-containing protein n=1 Tax=Aestuariirhabdus haliotis TaxID=2918751 RepID=UPI00201B40A8|nr:DUF1302 domain-containing protein [Aestuariirhabdus haliotis]MCL6416164.1 DUF1302 domain-containing protein [Aestuariirhabdus haliotis]MCL6420216.1 DUF1302 domain-containing protein [Aestuariirhabdus haliotis]